MATIKDIAEKSGVSRGTVDRVLHNRGRVDPAVAEKILEIAKELSYRPNRAGQTLATKGRKRRIAVVLPSLSNPFFLSVKRGMEVAMEENDMELSFFHYSGYGESECRDVLEKAISSAPASLPLTLPDSPSLVTVVSESSIPFACVNMGLSSDLPLFYSGPDYTQKGRINAGLVTLASTSFVPRILVLRGSSVVKGHREILDGFRSALDERGVEYSVAQDVDTEDDDALSFRATKEALEKDGGINTVFIATAGSKGALDAIGEKKLFVFASDETEEVCSAVEDGRISWTISQDPFLQGYHGVKKMAEYVMTGERPSDFVARNVVKIKENIGEELCW